MQEEFQSDRIVTLTDFIRGEQTKYPAARGTFTNIMLSIALGGKVLSRGVARAGLASMLGLSGKKNVQGEEVRELDDYSDKVFSNTVGRCGEFISMVSEERDKLFPAAEGSKQSSYVIAFDPVDGSSNIDVNVSIGTIWSIYRRLSGGDRVDPSDTRDFLQPGTQQVAAGYILYGSSTMFVFSSGQGVNGFTLDPTIGEFILTHSQIQMPCDGSVYSCNEGNYGQWSPAVRGYVDSLRSRTGDGSRGCSLRYIGSLVADFHRTLLKGGVFLYPADKANPDGKLRVLYECAPLGFLAEQAGGSASNGYQRSLDVVPGNIHQRSPLFIGSKNMVAELERRIKGFDEHY